MLQPATPDVVTLDPISQPEAPARVEGPRGLLGYDVTIPRAAQTISVTRGSAAR